MTPKRPIELVNASKACAEAWQLRDDMIEAGDTVGVQAMNLACQLLDERHATIYREWQILGGTSNIESIAHPDRVTVALDEQERISANWGVSQEYKDSQPFRNNLYPY